MPGDFDLDDFRRNRMFKMITRNHEVTLLFPARAATFAKEKWPDRAKPQKDGSVEISFRVDRLENFIPIVLGFGPGVKTLHPPEFRDMVIANAEKTLELYS
jgi:predicted DNA-binding transcriptional regulator YafY